MLVPFPPLYFLCTAMQYVFNCLSRHSPVSTPLSKWRRPGIRTQTFRPSTLRISLFTTITPSTRHGAKVWMNRHQRKCSWNLWYISFRDPIETGGALQLGGRRRGHDGKCQDDFHPGSPGQKEDEKQRRNFVELDAAGRVFRPCHSGKLETFRKERVVHVILKF